MHSTKTKAITRKIIWPMGSGDSYPRRRGFDRIVIRHFDCSCYYSRYPLMSRPILQTLQLKQDGEIIRGEQGIPFANTHATSFLLRFLDLLSFNPPHQTKTNYHVRTMIFWTTFRKVIWKKKVKKRKEKRQKQKQSVNWNRFGKHLATTTTTQHHHHHLHHQYYCIVT